MPSPLPILAFAYGVLATDVPMPIDSAAKYVLGVIAVAFLPVYLYVRKEFVPRWIYDEQRKRLDLIESDVATTNETSKSLAASMTLFGDNQRSLIRVMDAIAETLKGISDTQRQLVDSRPARRRSEP